MIRSVATASSESLLSRLDAVGKEEDSRERKKERKNKDKRRPPSSPLFLSLSAIMVHALSHRPLRSLSLTHTHTACADPRITSRLHSAGKQTQTEKRKRKKETSSERKSSLSFIYSFFSLSPLHSLSILPLLDTAAPQGSMRVGCQLQSTKYKRAHQCWKRERELVGHIISPLKERKRREIFLLFHFGRPISRPSVQSLEN